jgi:hypothetical protein
MDFLRPSPSPLIDPNSHYYFFTGILVAVTAAASVVTSIAGAALQTERARRQWARDRIQDLARYAKEPNEFEQSALLIKKTAEFEVKVKTIIDRQEDRDFPNGKANAKLWALDASRILRQASEIERRLPTAVTCSVATIVYSLLAIIFAPWLGKCQWISVVAWCTGGFALGVTLYHLWSLSLPAIKSHETIEGQRPS